MDSFRDTDRVDADIIVETIDDDFVVAVVEAVAMGDADDGDSAFVMLVNFLEDGPNAEAAFFNVPAQRELLSIIVPIFSHF